MLNSKTNKIMAQLSISFGIGFESRSNNNQSFVKVAHRSSITANEAEPELMFQDYEHLLGQTACSGESAAVFCLFSG